MQLLINDTCFFIFDLDDTLFQEIDFLKSAYKHISNKLSEKIGYELYDEMLLRYYKKENVFQWIINQYSKELPDIDTNWLITEYREHYPALLLSESTATFLGKVKELGIPMGLITDGRSTTQRNKLKALGIENMFSDIIISEEFGSTKPNPKNYQYFEDKYLNKTFYYIGDNPAKDFIVPKKLGWLTICLKDNGNNIHSQEKLYSSLPDFIINSFEEVHIKPLDYAN